MTTVSSEFAEALKSSARYSLETLAFTEINPVENSVLTKQEQEYLGTRISMGTLGTMHLLLGKNLLQEIVNVLLSPAPEEVSEEMLNDSLNEILNIISGRFLESIFKNQSDFALGLPEHHLNLMEWNSLPLRCVLATDEGMELAVGIGPSPEEQ